MEPVVKAGRLVSQSIQENLFGAFLGILLSPYQGYPELALPGRLRSVIKLSKRSKLNEVSAAVNP